MIKSPFCKCLSLILSISLIMCCTIYSASAENTTQLQGTVTIDSFKAGGSSLFPSGSAKDQYPRAYSAIVNAIKSFNSSVTLTAFSIPFLSGVDQTQQPIYLLYSEILDNNPELFYASKTFSYFAEEIFSNKIVTKIQLEYTVNEAEYANMKNQFNEQTNQLVALTNDTMSEAQKALVLHDALANKCEYDVGVNTNTEGANAYNAYGALVQNKAVCQGYAYAYKHLLDQVGIESQIVTSSELNHAWNLVKIDNNYYHVDVTWDDPVPDILGNVYHTYFLLSDSSIQQSGDYKTAHTGYTLDDVAASNTKYDDYFWGDVESSFQNIGNKWYFVNTAGQLVSTDLDFSNQVVIRTLTKNWMYSNNIRYSLYFGKILQYGGNLYYNLANSIYKVDLDGASDQLICTMGNYPANQIFGIKTLDNILYGTIIGNFSFSNMSNVILADLSSTQPTTVNPPTVPTTGTTTATSEPMEVTTARPTTTPTQTTTATPTGTTSVTPTTEPTEPTTAVATTTPIQTTTAKPTTAPTQSTTVKPSTAPTQTTTKNTDPTEATTSTQPVTTAPHTDATESTTAKSSTAPTQTTTQPTSAGPTILPTQPTSTGSTTMPTIATGTSTLPTNGTSEPQSTTTPLIAGDANDDGTVNIKDATSIQRYLAGLLELSPTGLTAGDVDGKKGLSISDATTIQKFIANIISSLLITV